MSADLSAFAGQTVRLRIAVCASSLLYAAVDSVSVTSTPPPPPEETVSEPPQSTPTSIVVGPEGTPPSAAEAVKMPIRPMAARMKALKEKGALAFQLQLNSRRQAAPRRPSPIRAGC